MKPATLAVALGLASLIAAPASTAQFEVEPLLVEVQPDPLEETYEREWVEFANPAPFPLSLEGFYLTDHDACFVPGEGLVENYRWPLNATVPASSRLVILLPDNCLNLANSGDDLALENEDGDVIQSVAYGEEGNLDAPESGQSLSACHHTNEIHGAWGLALQSPGRTNPDCPDPAV